MIYAKDTYVCLGEGTSDSLAYSSDGISWTGIGNSLLTSGFSADYGNGRFIAGGQGNHTLIYSLDGVNWTAYTTSLVMIVHTQYRGVRMVQRGMMYLEVVICFSRGRLRVIMASIG